MASEPNTAKVAMISPVTRAARRRVSSENMRSYSMNRRPHAAANGRHLTPRMLQRSITFMTVDPTAEESRVIWPDRGEFGEEAAVFWSFPGPILLRFAIARSRRRCCQPLFVMQDTSGGVWLSTVYQTRELTSLPSSPIASPTVPPGGARMAQSPIIRGSRISGQTDARQSAGDNRKTLQTRNFGVVARDGIEP